MTHKSADTLAEMEFDGWATEDAVDLVAYETTALVELAEQKGRRSAELPKGLDAPQRQSPQQRREELDIDGTPPGVLARPAVRRRRQRVQVNPPAHYEELEMVNPFVPPAPAQSQVASNIRRFVAVRWQQFSKGLLWRLAWLSSVAVGSAALIVSAGRWQQSETLADARLREQCVEVTNAQGEVAADKVNGVAALLGKDRKALTSSLGAPYCSLPKTSVRAGAIVDRSLYQLPGDRQMVVALEGDKVIGYGVEAEGETGAAVGDRQDFDLRQSWSWLTGSTVAEREVIGGLGSVALAMDGPVHAPMDGVVSGEAALVAEGQLSRMPDSCAVFTSVQLPAYAVQLCGLRDRQVGEVKKGKEIGRGNGLVHLAILRRDGKQWMFVPPAQEIVEQILGEAA
ncbi:MAG: hypothetical protein AAF889_01765 [Cyanobacteria bacterium P01_D01_bin.73]